MTVFSNDYKVGRGSAYFAPFVPTTQTPGGEAFFGDVNSLNVSIKATQLDHYQSTGGVKTIDQSATIQSDSSGALVTENISVANLALFFFGSASKVAVTGAAVVAESVPNIAGGLYYQLGISTDPVGARGLDSTAAALVKNGASTYVAVTDYVVDYVLGRIYIVPGGAIDIAAIAALPAAYAITVGYTTKTTSRPRVLSGQTPIEGQLRFNSANSVGTDKDMLLPWVKLTPNGNYELIGDKYAMLTFDLKVLQKSGLAALYIDGRAV
jgi:hypothetical protein